MEIRKNFALFREFLKTKYKFACMYSNSMSQFADRNERQKVFTIKSDLAHDFDKDELLYISLNIGRVISRIFKDYVIGMGYSVDRGDKTKNEAFVKMADRIQLQAKLNLGVESSSAIGYSILRLRGIEQNGKKIPRLELIPLPNYVANMEGLGIGDDFRDIKEHFIYSVQKDDKGKKFLYVDRYEKQDDGTYKGYFGEKREYNKDFFFSNRFEEGEEEVLDFFPLYIFNNDLENPHVVDEINGIDGVFNIKGKGGVGEIPKYFNQSDYVDLADIIQELNDRESQISIEFIKNMTSKLSVPASFNRATEAQALRKKGDKAFAEIPDFIVHNAGETPAQYITKDASYVTTAINEYIPYLLKMISFISTIPSVLLANAIYGANNPVGTTEKEFQPFYSRVEAKQLKIYNELQRLFNDIMTYDGYKADDELPTIRFKKPAVYDVSERTNTAVMQMNAGIMSKASAIAYTMGYDETEVREELEKIDSETVNAYARDGVLGELFTNDNKEKDEEDTIE